MPILHSIKGHQALKIAVFQRFSSGINRYKVIDYIQARKATNTVLEACLFLTFGCPTSIFIVVNFVRTNFTSISTMFRECKIDQEFSIHVVLCCVVVRLYNKTIGNKELIGRAPGSARFLPRLTFLLPIILSLTGFLSH